MECKHITNFNHDCGHTVTKIAHSDHDCPVSSGNIQDAQIQLHQQPACRNSSKSVRYTYCKCDWCQGLLQGHSEAHSDPDLAPIPESIIEERRIFWRREAELQRLEKEAKRIEEERQHDLHRGARRRAWELQFRELRLQEESTNVPLTERIQFFDSRNPDDGTLFSTIEARLCDKEYVCTFCLDELEDDVRQLSCGHKYHLHCIKQWFENHDTCPLCRTKYRLVRVPSFDNSTSHMTFEEATRRAGNGGRAGPRRHARHPDRDQWARM